MKSFYKIIAYSAFLLTFIKTYFFQLFSRLELMLENALSEDYKPNLLRSSSDLEEDQGLEVENSNEGRRSIESVPLISYVSPR